MDHVAKAQSRIINEYRNKPRMLKWLGILPEIGNANIEPSILQLIESYDPDTAVDELLNVVGRVVGVPRPILRASDYQVFGYQGNENYTNYNVAPYIGAGGQIDAPLNNDLYRKLIKAKIARNITDGTYDSIMQLVEIIIDIGVTALNSNGDMTFDIGINSEIDNNTQFLIDNFDLIPAPQGTSFGRFFILPYNIGAIEAASSRIFNYANFKLPGDVA